MAVSFANTGGVSWVLDTVDLNARATEAEFKKAIDGFEVSLGALQRQLREARIPTIILIEGWDAAGKGSVLAHLLHTLDPRWYAVHTTTPPGPEENARPWLWRFWRRLPRRGNIGLFDEGWYRRLVDDRARGTVDDQGFENLCERVNIFESQLVHDGALVLKFFLHISKEEQARRFDEISRDPAFAWRIADEERERHAAYEKYFEAITETLSRTDTQDSPWHVVPSTDIRHATISIAQSLEKSLREAVSARQQIKLAPNVALGTRQPLSSVDLNVALSRQEYKAQVPQLQSELRRLQHLCYLRKTPVVIVYEGQDAAGKGGAIKRSVREMDPRGYQVLPVAAPEGEERDHHYLWRFWRDLPKAGHFAIFDRSWYGRVLVERIEGFAQPHEWQRAYQEINDFEAELAQAGAVVMKFWIHISKEEQLARFKAREKTEHKKWKITNEDWRNRKRWKEYMDAANDAIALTDTPHAPWVVVPGNDKPFARIAVMRAMVERLRHAVAE